MLWYKAWLETRWRFVFAVGSLILLCLAGPLLGANPKGLWTGFQFGSTLLYSFTAIFLAGAGINSQTFYAATAGFHGSMLFTLSLPVSRRQLFFVRAGLGAIETCVFVALTVGLALLWRPEATSASQALLYGTRAMVCTMTVYAMSALLACVFDEIWQFMGGCLCLGAILLLQIKVPWIREFSFLRGMSLMSYPITAPMPWAAVITSLVLTGVLLYASVIMLQRKEY